MLSVTTKAGSRAKQTQRVVKKSSATSRSTIDRLRSRTEALKQMEIQFIGNDAFGDRAAKRKILGQHLELGYASELSVTSAAKLPSHLARLCDAPLLQHEEEQALFCRMNYLLYRAATLRSKLPMQRPNVKKMDEVDSCLSEAIRVKNHIVAANIRLVVSIVKQLASSPSGFEDMLSDGLLAMMRAVEKFDFDRGFRFSTYATMVIRRQLYRSMKNEHRDRGRFPSADNVLLSEHAEQENDPRIGFHGWNRLSETLGKMITQLDAREQLIIRARFGFDTDGKKQTLQSLAKEFGVCKERVRQLEKRAMTKLRAFADGMDLEPLVDPEFAMA